MHNFARRRILPGQRATSSRLFRADALEPRVLLSAGYALTSDISLAPDGNGTNPTTLIMDASGDLFGITSYGGLYNDGTVFEIPRNTTTIETLASFDGTDGSLPSCLTIDPNGNLFGVTAYGGLTRSGTIFEMNAGSNTIQILTNLDDFNGPANPGQVVYLNGNLYGTHNLLTTSGSVGEGSLFKVNTATGALTDLVTFTGPNGADPYGGLTLDSQGDLLGTTISGGTDNDGTIFSFSPAGNSLSTVADFSLPNLNPDGGLAVDSSGDIFGPVDPGGANTEAAIFEIASGSHTVTTLASFNGSNGNFTDSGVVLDSSGNLYGTTPDGLGSDYGTVFEILRGSNTISTVVQFGASDMMNPNENLVAGPNGSIFGTAGGTGSIGGSVFQVSDNSLTTIASFANIGPNAFSGSLVSNAGGDVFGTSTGGGTDGDGTIFELSQGSNSIIDLASFDGADGMDPQGNLTIDSSGDLFGAATLEGIIGAETIYEVRHGSTAITNLATISGLESYLAFDSAGNIFGVTSSGGTHGFGDIFEIGRGSHQVTTIVNFNVHDAPGLDVSLALDSAGDIFGSASSGVMTFFDVPSGAHSLHFLSNVTGSSLFTGPLVIDSSGDLFSGGVDELAHGSRQVVDIAPGSVVNDQNSQFAIAESAYDSNGNVFGATTGAGQGSDGTVYEVPKDSDSLTTIATLDSSTGTNPSGITVDPSGDIYVTTTTGGTSGNGAILKFTPANAPPPVPTQLVFTTAPFSVIVGVTPAPPIAVTVDDANGIPVLTDNSTVTLSIASGPTGAVLGGKTTAFVVNGVATFPGLTFNEPGEYELEASDGELNKETTDVYVSMPSPSLLVPTIENISFPPAVVAGYPLKTVVPLLIANGGNAFKGVVTIDVYADYKPGIDGRLVSIGSFTGKIAIPANGDYTVDVPTSSIPGPLWGGTYHLLAQLTDPTGAMAMATTTQTVQIEAPFIQPAVSLGETMPASIAPGESASVLVTVTNNGNVTANGVYLSLSPSSDGVTPIAGVTLGTLESNEKIPPNESKTFRIHMKFTRGLAPGVYIPYVSILLDGVTDTAEGARPFRVT